MAKLNINGKVRDVQVEDDTPLLWVIREQVGLTGTKYGCGVASAAPARCTSTARCSAPARSRVGDRQGRPTRSSPSRASRPTRSHPVQKAWATVDVPQCGYCQSGQIMAAAALLKKKPHPTDKDIDAAMTNICRCGTYQRIREAVHMAAGDTDHRQQDLREGAMRKMTFGKGKHLSRRKFIVGSAAAAGGGFALGMSVPFPGEAARAERPPRHEVNVWVAIKPDDTCVIRIARSEMGQGTLTGLAQLVAEELECDWSKVTTEGITPGRNLAAKRAWGDMSTGGSRGIRGSQDYVRRGGAVARMMLLQAAADQWKVPVAERHRREGRHHARREQALDPLRQGRGGRVEADAARSEGDQAQGPEELDHRRQGRSSGSTPPTSSTAARSTRSTSSCPACSTPRSRTARCSAARW